MPKIRVPQESDEISISRNGDVHDPTVYPVTDHTVEVADEDVEHFLAVIDGAELVDMSDGAPLVANDDTPQTKKTKADTPPA